MKPSKKRKRDNFNKITEDLDFTQSINLIFKVFYRISKKASFKIGFGMLALGLVFFALEDQGFLIRLFIGIGAFCILAKIGAILDQAINVKN